MHHRRLLKLIASTTLMFCTPFLVRGQESQSVLDWARISFDYRVFPNLAHKRANGQDIELDVYAAADTRQARPTLIFIHGGGWSWENKENHVLLLLPFLAHEMNAVNVEYRLASQSLAPAAVEDCRCALRWIYRHASDYQFDTSKLVVAGESTGGHLSLMTGMLDPAAGFDNECPGDENLKAAAVVNYYGISDVVDVLTEPHQTSWAVMWFGSLPNRLELAKRLSPLSYVRPGLPPIITVHGDADTLLYQQSVRLHEALSRAGVPNQLVRKGDPPAMPGRQQQFDRSGSPSGTLLIVSREAHEKEIHDGRTGKPIAYEVGVQISCCVHSEMPSQGTLPGTAAAFGGSIPQFGEAERECD